MKRYSVVYETECAVNAIYFDTIEEVVAFFIQHGNEIRHYALFKHSATKGYIVIAEKLT